MEFAIMVPCMGVFDETGGLDHSEMISEC